jgi:hypothetical protein
MQKNASVAALQAKKSKLTGKILKFNGFLTIILKLFPEGRDSNIPNFWRFFLKVEKNSTR